MNITDIPRLDVILYNKSCLLQIVEKMVSLVQNAVLTSCMYALYVDVHCKHRQISRNFRISSGIRDHLNAMP